MARACHEGRKVEERTNSRRRMNPLRGSMEPVHGQRAWPDSRSGQPPQIPRKSLPASETPTDPTQPAIQFPKLSSRQCTIQPAIQFSYEWLALAWQCNPPMSTWPNRLPTSGSQGFQCYAAGPAPARRAGLWISRFSRRPRPWKRLLPARPRSWSQWRRDLRPSHKRVRSAPEDSKKVCTRETL